MNQTELQNNLRGLSIVVASNSLQHRKQLQSVFECTGIRVLFNEPLSRIFLSKLDTSMPDLVLLDIAEDDHAHDDILEQLLDRTELPILFNDMGMFSTSKPDAKAAEYARLLEKIAAMRGISDWSAANLNIAQYLSQSGKSGSGLDAGLARNVWALGASLGGPDALKQFLQSLPRNIPATFIIAQHLGESFVALFAEQLQRATHFNVLPAKAGHVLRHGDVIVAPVNERIIINPLGAIQLEPLTDKGTYSPSIDLVISDIARRYTQTAGTIIFSGMCDDGAIGAAVMKQNKGTVWVQDADSCVISAMPDNVRQSGSVSFSGTPVQIGAKLVMHLRQMNQD